MDKKYILTEWPESQDFVGNPECYLVHSLDHNERQLDSAYFVPEDLFIDLQTNNKEVTDITQYHEQYKTLETLMKESIRKYLSRKLMYTSVENPLKTKICLVNSEGFGLSSLNFPWIYYMYQDPVEGIIYFGFDETDSEPVEFDEMLLEDLITICQELDK
jgi:hypothetical protein